VTLKNAFASDDFKNNDGPFHGRLTLESATQLSLRPYNGKHVGVSGQLVEIPWLADQTIVGFTVDTSATLISSDGLNTGLTPSASTVYYVYVSNGFAKYAPKQLRLSSSSRSTNKFGVNYLGTSENATNWRYVGMVKTIDAGGGVPNFVDSETQRFVINWNNPRPLKMFTCPGYVDQVAPVSYAETTSANWKEIHGGVGSRLSFLSHGQDVVKYYAKAYLDFPDEANDYASIGVGHDDIVTVEVLADPPYNTDLNKVIGGDIQLHHSYVPAEGDRQLLFLITPTATASINVSATGSRMGATASPAYSYLEAWVMG